VSKLNRHKNSKENGTHNTKNFTIEQSLS